MDRGVETGEREISADAFRWLLAGSCATARLPFDATRFLARFRSPYDPGMRRPLILAIVAGLAACTPNLRPYDAAGAEFRKALARIDAECKELKMGPYLDRSDPDYTYKARNARCDILKLEPRDPRTVKLVKLDGRSISVPEHWLRTPEGRFAHSIPLPPQYDDLDKIHREGMNGEEYFRALCGQAAGEFIFRQVHGVKGVLQARPWIERPHPYTGLVFWTVEKGGVSASPQNYLLQPHLGRFDFLDVLLSGDEQKKTGKRYRAFYRSFTDAPKKDYPTSKDGRFVTVPYIVATRLADKSSAEYGYTWRGLWLENAVEHGIEGDELIIFKRQPLEVLGFQRRFMHYQIDAMRTGRNVPRDSCPEEKLMSFRHEFVQRVLVPANPE